MAGTLTVTEMTNPYGDTPQHNKIILDWLSDASAGTVSSDICSTFAAAQKVIGENMPQPSKLNGYIVAIETIPGLKGDKTTTCPTALYDITLDDEYGYDVAGGVLANRSASVAETKVPSQPIPIDSEITVSISNAGNEKTGRIIILLKEV